MHPFANLPPTPATHFKLYLYGAITHVLEQLFLAFGSPQAAYQQFPFLSGYADELAACGLSLQTTTGASTWWRDALAAWEETIPNHLPLRALRENAALEYAALTLLLSIGLIEEDARFGVLFEALQATPGQRRPTFGLLNAWWRAAASGDDARPLLRQLQALGLVHAANPDAPRHEWVLQAPEVIWDAIRGEAHERISAATRYHAPDQLTAVEALIVPDDLRRSFPVISSLLASGEARTLVVRGPGHNGRRTLVGAIARGLGCGMLEVDRSRISSPSLLQDEHWRIAGPLATLLHAIPTIVLDPTPGETCEIPALQGYDGPLAVVLGACGGLQGAGVERVMTVTLNLPDIHTRRLHWEAGFRSKPATDLDQLAERVRMTSGNIRRVATVAQTHASLANRATITFADVQHARRTLQRQTLETLATLAPVSGDWSQLAVNAETMSELLTLEGRCRYRERLRDVVGAAAGAHLNPGVRALFSGPSGAGKTLAACILASVLQMDLYRLDLSAVVNKYIGETEKNLNQVFARAEELDVILLLDEGDALLTQRTDVQTANDRYANLETNYLLQRIESFTGVLLVTTNAVDRIDNAFQRRMDVVVDFRPPDAGERWLLWQLHLPATHAVPQSFIDEVAHRCVLSGGQIRNVVLHAAVLALSEGEIITVTHLEAALQREYRKSGAVCPLRRSLRLSMVQG